MSGSRQSDYVQCTSTKSGKQNSAADKFEPSLCELQTLECPHAGSIAQLLEWSPDRHISTIFFFKLNVFMWSKNAFAAAFCEYVIVRLCA